MCCRYATSTQCNITARTPSPPQLGRFQGCVLSDGSQIPCPKFFFLDQWKRLDLFSAAFPTLPVFHALSVFSTNKAIHMPFCSADRTSFISDFSYYFAFQGCHVICIPQGREGILGTESKSTLAERSIANTFHSLQKLRMQQLIAYTAQ